MLMLALLLIPVYAQAQEEEASVDISVSCGGGEPEDKHTVLLSLQDTPHLSAFDQELVLSEGQEGKFTIKADYPGEYHFSIRQKGDKSDSLWDRSVYEGTLYVTEQSEGLKAEAVLSRKGGKGKSARAAFTDGTPPKDPGQKGKGYPSSPTPEVKTGDSSPIGVYLALMVGAAGVIVLTARVYKERKQNG